MSLLLVGMREGAGLKPGQLLGRGEREGRGPASGLGAPALCPQVVWTGWHAAGTTENTQTCAVFSSSAERN